MDVNDLKGKRLLVTIDNGQIINVEHLPDSVVIVQPPAEAVIEKPGPAISRMIPWGATVPADFIEGVLWIEGQIGLDAGKLMNCMKFESNLNAQAKNPSSSATGLIQFMEATAKRLGTTTAKLAQMGMVTQLSYVYKYFKEYHDRGFDLSKWTLEDVYMSILWPSAIGKPLGYQVFVTGSSAYKVNAGLDINKDGYVTKEEACLRVNRLAVEGMKNGNVLVITKKNG